MGRMARTLLRDNDGSVAYIELSAVVADAEADGETELGTKPVRGGSHFGAGQFRNDRGAGRGAVVEHGALPHHVTRAGAHFGLFQAGARGRGEADFDLVESGRGGFGGAVVQAVTRADAFDHFAEAFAGLACFDHFAAGFASEFEDIGGGEVGVGEGGLPGVGRFGTGRDDRVEDGIGGVERFEGLLVGRLVVHRIVVGEDDECATAGLVRDLVADVGCRFDNGGV